MSALRPLRIALGSAALATALFGAQAAFAHHSFAMFDATKEISVTGTVKEFAWANPHVWIDVTVMGEDGKPQNWGVEAANLGSLYRMGWTKDSLKPGDKITVKVHPMRSGSPGGQLLSVTFPDGHELRAAG